jgi:hypothetical protein
MCTRTHHSPVLDWSVLFGSDTWCVVRARHPLLHSRLTQDRVKGIAAVHEDMVCNANIKIFLIVCGELHLVPMFRGLVSTHPYPPRGMSYPDTLHELRERDAHGPQNDASRGARLPLHPARARAR